MLARVARFEESQGAVLRDRSLWLTLVGPLWCSSGSSGHGCPTPRGCTGEAERAEAGQVDCRGQESEIGGDLVGAPNSGPSPAVMARHQVPDLAFHLGPRGPVVGDPVRVTWSPAGIGQLLLVGPDVDGTSGGGAGALLAQRAAGAGLTESGSARVILARRIGAVAPAGQVTVSCSRSTSKRSLVNMPAAATGCWVLHLSWIPAPPNRSWNGPVP